MSVEKREYTRLKLNVPVELRTETSPSPIRFETADLGLGGCYIETIFTLELGKELEITLQLGDSTLLAFGEVVTRDPNVGNGIRFTKMLPEDRDELERFLLEAAETEQKTDIPPDKE